MGKFTLARFFQEQWGTRIPKPKTSAEGKTIIVTGGNIGLGFEAAKHIARLSPERLLITSRDAGRGEGARKKIEQKSSISVGVAPIDLSSFDSVRAFADGFGDGKLDCLLLNAGVSMRVYSATKDGWESTIQVNYLSNALLSILLLPNLIKSSTPEVASRIVFVSSYAHYQIKNLDDVKDSSNILKTLSDEKYCTERAMRLRYMLSKYLVGVFVRELSARLPSPTPVAVSAINPGFCHSSILRNWEEIFIIKVMLKSYAALFARSTEMGSRTLVHAALDPEERKFHNHYISNCEIVEESDFLLSEEGRKVSARIWTETIDVLKELDPRVEGIVSEYLSEPKTA
ncbi:WW domain-containing oxidoreductase [Grifola frondosa]|uniref:WW domain-containing oxidoreductase n=1 Tax=Grifola frondosa TaxID=5627 RepID=A0A1C7M8U5_GRIFR|nr:WW domain-containing oxidoreductase [Grifola frondosa]